MGQEKFGALYDLGGQGNVTQYINGHIPINLEAAIKFAHALNVQVSAISPTLGKIAAYVRPYDADPLLAQLITMYTKLSPDGRDAVILRANRIYSEEFPEDRGADPFPIPLPTGPKHNPSTTARRIPK